ncbi:MAG: hypothetical protein LBT50_06430, partial [Prevotellaceae bacterium]|jgi:hypothetical protein|nr:hypothetical protein [Prevotellaceae bacterium]
MKSIKLLLIAVCLLTATEVFSQNYIQQPGLDKFVGTWEWTSGNEKFQLIITKQKVYMDIHGLKEYDYEDIPVAYHSYTKNGKVVSSSMNKMNITATTSSDISKVKKIKGHLMAPDYISLLFLDEGKNDKLGKIDFKLVQGKTDEATWHLFFRRAGEFVTGVPGNQSVPEGYSMPTDVVMKKVKNTTTPPVK